MNSPRLIQTYLLDGTLEGVRIIELSRSDIKAFVVPRLKIGEIQNQAELKQPALYLLINSSDGEVYIGESESFYQRIYNHLQKNADWDLAIAIVSTTNSLEKGDIKYLESMTVEKAKATGAVKIRNKTAPARNNIHQFKLHTLENILDDIAIVAESIGYSLFGDKQQGENTTWICQTKKTDAKAQFRGDKFVVLAGSVIDKSCAESWKESYAYLLEERLAVFKQHGIDKGDTIELQNNVPFRSPNMAGHFVAGRSVNAWTTWKNSEGKTMDEVMRREG